MRRIIREYYVRVIPVVADEKTLKLIGVVRRGNLLYISSTRTEFTARDIMDEPKIVARPSDDARELADRLIETDEWYAPVVDDAGKLLGLVGLENIIGYVVNHEPEKLMKPVEEFMERNVVYVEPTTPVYKVWQVMMSKRFAALPVVSEGKLIGVIAEHDLIVRGFARPDFESPSGIRRGPLVRELMSTPPVTVLPTVPLLSAARLIVERYIGRVYVVDDDESLLGVVDRSDIVRAWLTAR
ncbi:conserved archaeal protein [Hyperthermus butylicus DSM 5456]|uniref:Conserved archaeal protein n=1 Tax=Hyperthermus butylicus (strain DSM 5456 / JCM 9403 / PLM1-5) TaxID=415426 RepID=A2BLX2_HYPBU|nr:conserved archaeal protein [Hyperthermus butylicus DSM 5456]